MELQVRVVVLAQDSPVVAIIMIEDVHNLPMAHPIVKVKIEEVED